MALLGGLLIVLALPLLITYAIQEKKNKTWLRLGILLGAFGIVIIALGSLVRL